MTVRLSTAARNASTNAVVGLIDAGAAAGTIKVYSGTQPATADTAAAGALLATIALGDPAFGASASGQAAGADPASVNASASGTAAWFRVADSNGATVFDGSVTASGAGGDMQLSSTALTSGGSVDITSLTYTTPAG